MDDNGRNSFGAFTPTKRGTLAEMLRLRRKHGGFGGGGMKRVEVGSTMSNLGSRVDSIPFPNSLAQINSNQVFPPNYSQSSHQQEQLSTGYYAEKRSRRFQPRNFPNGNDEIFPTNCFNSEPILGLDRTEQTYLQFASQGNCYRTGGMNWDLESQSQPEDHSRDDFFSSQISQSLLCEESLPSRFSDDEGISERERRFSSQECSKTSFRDNGADQGYFSQSSQSQSQEKEEIGSQEINSYIQEECMDFQENCIQKQGLHNSHCNNQDTKEPGVKIHQINVTSDDQTVYQKQDGLNACERNDTKLGSRAQGSSRNIKEKNSTNCPNPGVSDGKDRTDILIVVEKIRRKVRGLPDVFSALCLVKLEKFQEKIREDMEDVLAFVNETVTTHVLKQTVLVETLLSEICEVKNKSDELFEDLIILIWKNNAIEMDLIHKLQEKVQQLNVQLADSPECFAETETESSERKNNEEGSDDEINGSDIKASCPEGIGEVSSTRENIETNSEDVSGRDIGKQNFDLDYFGVDSFYPGITVNKVVESNPTEISSQGSLQDNLEELLSSFQPFSENDDELEGLLTCNSDPEYEENPSLDLGNLEPDSLDSAYYGSADLI